MGNWSSTERKQQRRVLRRKPASVDVHECLHNHSKEFDHPEVIQVSENVFLAIGFGLANSALIVGDEGCVVIDTMESQEAASNVMQAFREYMQGKPVSAVIYTHNHADHVMGTKAVVERDGSTKIWAHTLCEYYLKRILQATGEVTYRRGMRQFGVMVPENQFVNSGIGPFLLTKGDEKTDIRFPTHTFQDEVTIEEGGVKLKLVHCPGETNDQLAVWYEDQKILFAADNIYKAFPNIYAIRGTPSRDAMQWVNSLDKMKAFGAEHMVLGHTRPIHGKEHIRELITIYRDAIQYVHDQTLRWVNTGMYLDDIVEIVRLPKEMEEHEYLQPFYGTVEWTVRAVFTHYLGWFGGDPEQLRPLPRQQHAVRMANLAGGEGQLLQKGMESLTRAQQVQDDLEEKRIHAQWALELFNAFLALPQVTGPSKKKAIEAKVESLEILGSCQPSATGRNYYLTCAAEAAGLEFKVGKNRAAGSIQSTETMLQILQLLSVRYAPEIAGDTRTFKAQFVFPDTEEVVNLEMRRGICVVSPGQIDLESKETNPADDSDTDSEFDLVVQVSTQVWRDIVSKKKNPKLAFAQGEIKCIKGKITQLAKMMSWFIRA